jgi:predicted acyl esterase
MVELMESIIPYPLGEAAYNAALVTGINPELYRVIPQQAGNVSAAVEFKQDQGQAYRNAESTPSTGADGRVLYLVIIPTLSGDAPTGKDADETEMDPLTFTTTAGTGSFTLRVSALSGSVHDKFKVDYIVV